MRRLLVIVAMMLMCGSGWAQSQTDSDAIARGTLKTAYGTSFSILSTGQVDAPLVVLLVPGKWGLNTELKGWLTELAGQGVRVAMDLFDGRPVRNRAMATDVWNSIDPVWIAADLDGAVTSLSRQGGSLVIMSWEDSLPFVQSALARHPDQVQGLIAVGRQVSVDVPLLLLNQADRSAAGSVRQFLARWH